MLLPNNKTPSFSCILSDFPPECLSLATFENSFAGAVFECVCVCVNLCECHPSWRQRCWGMFCLLWLASHILCQTVQLGSKEARKCDESEYVQTIGEPANRNWRVHQAPMIPIHKASLKALDNLKTWYSTRESCNWLKNSKKQLPSPHVCYQKQINAPVFDSFEAW